MKARTLPTQEELRELFTYDVETGELFAKIKFSRKTLAGMVLDCQNARGYVHFHYQGLFFYAHRVVWKLQTGEEPKVIDHINWNKSDNRIANLRSVTTSANNRHQQGVKGYYQHSNGRHYAEFAGEFLGGFATAREATERYYARRDELSGL
jgi:hypothetical protein